MVGGIQMMLNKVCWW